MKKMITIALSLLLILALSLTACAESKGRIAADAVMEDVYGQIEGVSYAFKSANESNRANHYYLYSVERVGNGLTLKFDVTARYEISWGRATVKSLEYYYFDPRGPRWDDEMERIWDLVGTYIYKDDERSFTLKIHATDGETLTAEYDFRGVEQGGYNFPIDNGRLASSGAVELEVVPYLGDDGSAWRICGDKAPNIWLYPFGRDLTKGGEGSGLSFQGYWLVKQ